jgi:integrase
MHGRHLTRSDSSWIFQMRVPRAFKTLQSLGCIRLNLGLLDKRAAQVAARTLAVSARQALGEAEGHLMTTNCVDESVDQAAIRTAILCKLRRDVEFLMPLHDGKNESGPVAAASLDRRMRDISIALAGADLAAASISEQTPAQDRRFDDILAAVSRLETASQASGQDYPANGGPSRKRAPKFGAAADSYYTLLHETHGDGYDELKYIRHRKAVFIEICGDKRVDDYTVKDLQHFINRVRFLPPNHSKRPGFKMSDINKVIDQNIEAGTAGLAESTLVNNYVGKVKTILRHGCAEAGVPFTLDGSRIKIPQDVQKTRQKGLPAHGVINAVFKKGVETGLLVEAILPLMGYLTGRRLGLLAFLQGSDIRQEHGCWVVAPSSHATVDGKKVRLPVKTVESLGLFVLHNFLDEIGFIAWARGKPGFVFEALHEAADPADTASKRMARLFVASGLDPSQQKMFHGLRHLKIAEARDAGFDPRTTRLQVGHELESVHDKYGGQTLRPLEIKAIAESSLPDDIDWSVFQNLDFSALSSARPRVGRKPKR